MLMGVGGLTAADDRCTSWDGNNGKKHGKSCHIRAGIRHSAPAHRGGHVQNRSRRREQRWGRYRWYPQGLACAGDMRLHVNESQCVLLRTLQSTSD